MSKVTNDSAPHPQTYPGIVQLKQGNQQLLYQETSQLDPFAAIFSKSYWQDKNAITGSASGRGKTLFIRHKSSELILRPYLRGGLPGKLLTDQFLFTGFEKTRAWREFFLLLDMLKLGLPVPEPVAASIVRTGLIYRNSIIIKRIPQARDLHQVLSHESLPNDVWRSIGASIYRFHQHQVYHHDLNIRNIMLDNKQSTWLIDFDRCGIVQGDAWKQKNLDRLHRSLVKEQNKTPSIQWTEENWQALLAGYQPD